MLLVRANAQSAEIVETDICVYGGAAGGVTAAVQAARMGKKVVLLNFNNHLGGLSSGGLGDTDVGNNGDTYIQGMAREFYRRVGAKYNQSTPKFKFEPKVAEAVFNEWVLEAGVPVYWNQRLASTTMVGQKITQITMESGNVFRAKMFIDASYEGDLMKQSGVSYTAGREANSQYGETINGIQTSTSGNQLRSGISAYVVPGDPSSGLIRGVNATPGGANGTADTLIQAFCYRMCLTNVGANRIMIPQPAGYDEADYEILLRSIEAGQTTDFWKLASMPNGKTDSNNSGGISCDFIGGNVGYVEADYTTREQMAKAHEKWQRGLVWTVQNHPRVPANIRSTWSQWGLPADEFLDTNHWPHQLYVREARRMISDYVMTEKNCMGTVVAADSICMGAYTMDSHNTQRYVSGGMVRNEGDIQRAVPAPYPISYRSIVPKVGQCQNLLVPWSVSSTHISFGSIRMEPVFMNVGQSAATAASFAIDDGITVQAVPYAKLKAQLLTDGQALSMSSTDDVGIIVDNLDAASVTIEGDWISSTSTAGFYGSNYIVDNNVDKGTKSVRFTPAFTTTDTYEVYMRWTNALPNRASNTPVDIYHSGGMTPRVVDQQLSGSGWVSLGTYSFAAGTSPSAGSVLIRTTGTNGHVLADAVRFVSTASVANVSLWDTDPRVVEPEYGGTDTGRITLGRAGDTISPLTVTLSISGTATPGADYQALPATVTFPAGQSSVVLYVTPLSDVLNSEGDETVVVSVAPGAGYAVTALNGAIMTIANRPYDPAAVTSPFVQRLKSGVPQKIVVFGTSLTAGGAWSTQMKSALDGAFPGLVTLVNCGGSGMTSEWGVANCQSLVVNQNPDVVFIEFSVNDAVDRFHMSLAQSRANLEAIINGIRIARPSCEIILQVMNAVIDRPEGDAGWRPKLPLYQQIYRDVGAEHGLLVIDHMPAWQSLLDQGTNAYHTYVPDGLHPNAAGYQLYVTPVILKSLGVPDAPGGPQLIMDSTDPTGITITGTWTASSANPGFLGMNYLHDGNADKGNKSVRYTPALTTAGNYPVYMRWVENTQRATNVPVDISHAGVTSTVTVNQQQPGTSWVLLGTYAFNAGTTDSVLIRTTGTTGTNAYVIADGVGFGPREGTVVGGTLPAVMLRVNADRAAEPLSTAALPRSSVITISRTGSVTSELTVALNITGTATNGVDYQSLPASVIVPVGASAVAVALIPLSDAAAEGDETVKLSVASNAAYTVASPGAATVTIVDRPFDEWRRANFSPAQLANNSISADLADPDGDGLGNLLENLTSSNPLQGTGGSQGTLGTVQIVGKTYLTLTLNRVVSKDLICVPEVSGNLVDWDGLPDVVSLTVTSDDGTTQTIVARCLIPMDEMPLCFIRFNVSRLQ